MTTYFTFETLNRYHSVKAEDLKEATRLAIASVLSRLVKADPFMTGETFECLQTGLEIEFASAKINELNV